MVLERGWNALQRPWNGAGTGLERCSGIAQAHIDFNK
jgi:hypothetical protein